MMCSCWTFRSFHRSSEFAGRHLPGNDLTYFGEIQLPREGAPVEDRHFHPVEPRTLRLTIEARF